MSALITHCHISGADLVLKSGNFACSFRVVLVKNKHCIDHKGVEHSIRGTPNHSVTFKGGYEILEKQWVHIITTRYHICQADLVSKEMIVFLEI